jgi:hypothetical protein
MLQRTLIVLSLYGVLSASVSAQTAKDLMFHQRAIAGMEMTQLAVVLPVPPPPPDAAQRTQLALVPPDALPLAVAAVGYLTNQGYLHDGAYGVDVSRTDSGWVIHVSLPGPDTDIWVHAPGPTFPVPTDNVPRVLTSILAVRAVDISNGF